MVAVEVTDLAAADLKANSPRRPGPAVTPGHEMTSSVICWLGAACVGHASIVRARGPASHGQLVLGPSMHGALRYRRADAQARVQPGRVVEHRRRSAQGPRSQAQGADRGRRAGEGPPRDGGRRGKAVTTVADVPLDDAGLKDLAGRLKRRCGVGGSVKDGVIELQGDHRDVVVELLRAEGYDVVLAGG